MTTLIVKCKHNRLDSKHEVKKLCTQIYKQPQEKEERLTTGPDLPVKPIGPGGPLIASCRPDTGKNKVRFHSVKNRHTARRAHTCLNQCIFNFDVILCHASDLYRLMCFIWSWLMNIWAGVYNRIKFKSIKWIVTVRRLLNCIVYEHLE